MPPLLYPYTPAAFPDVTHVNLAGDYRYLLSGYYDSLDAELKGARVLPTTEEALDAYVVPIMLGKAERAGVAVPEYEFAIDKLPPLPVMAYPVNPFMDRGALITDAAEAEKQRKALSMTGKYAVICQRLSGDYRIDVARVVMGRCLVAEYEGFAQRVFEAFRLPLMRVRVIVNAREYLLSAIEPLPFSHLTLNEKKLLEGLEP